MDFNNILQQHANSNNCWFGLIKIAGKVRQCIQIEPQFIRKNRFIFLKQTYNKVINMNESSLSFRVTSPSQLLSNQEFSSVHINGYFSHNNQNNQLFRSTMDEEFYAPVRKKSIEVFKDEEEEETIQFDCLGKPEESRELDREKFELLAQNVQVVKSKGTTIQKAHENLFSKKANEYKQKQKPKNQIQLPQNLEIKRIITSKQQKKILKNAVKILIINKLRHLQLESLLVQINLSILQQIFVQFQQHQYFIPILNSKKYNSNCEQNDRFLNAALQSYFEYINEIHPVQFWQYLKKYNEKKQTPIITHQQSLTNIGLKKIGQLMSTIVKSFNLSNSRIITLEKTLLCRVRTLKQMKQHLKQICGLQFFQQQYNTIEQQQEKVWQSISKIQLLLCLQDSQKYCNEKIKECEPSQKNLWIKHRNIIKKQLARKLIEIQHVCI